MLAIDPKLGDLRTDTSSHIVSLPTCCCFVIPLARRLYCSPYPLSCPGSEFLKIFLEIWAGSSSTEISEKFGRSSASRRRSIISRKFRVSSGGRSTPRRPAGGAAARRSKRARADISKNLETDRPDRAGGGGEICSRIAAIQLSAVQLYELGDVFST